MYQKEKLSVFKVIRKFSEFGLTNSRKALLFLLQFSTAFFEGFGIAMLLPVLEFIEKGMDINVLIEKSKRWAYMSEIFGYFNLPITLGTLLTVVMVLMLSRVLFMFFRQLYQAWLTQHIMHITRSKLTKSFLSMTYGAYDDQSSGKLVNLLTLETTRIGTSFQSFFQMISNALVMLGFLFVLISLSPLLTFSAFAFLGLGGGIVAYTVRHMRQLSYKTTDDNSRLSHILFERLSSFRLIKLTGKSDRESNYIHSISKEVRNNNFRITKLISTIDLVLEPFVIISGVGILYISIILFKLSLSQVGIFLFILIRLLPLTKEFLKQRQSYLACIGSVEAVFSGYEHAMESSEQTKGEIEFVKPKDGILFNQVCFSYKGSKSLALKNIDIQIPAGKITAFVGPSGAGKSTLVDLIPNLRKPVSGQIFIDHRALDEYSLDSLRNNIAFVSQDTSILDDTVVKNMQFVKENASVDEIESALKKSKALDFVNELPSGMETILGEKGTKLSGGQKQRLSMARALLQNASILILDEPTSALDSETEIQIQKSIDDIRRKGEITIIIIAHRLSTIQGADKIIVLEDGQVVQQGTHTQLMVDKDWYARICGIQNLNDDQSEEVV